MRNNTIFLKLFCVGFLIAAGIYFSLSCSDKKSPFEPDQEPQNQSEYFETEEMKILSDSLIAAFKSENKNMVFKLLDEECRDIYSTILINSNKSLIEYGNALENRELKFANELYAEYEVSINNETYTLAYANSGDSKWRLIRF